jgi:hypothetical protein
MTRLAHIAHLPTSTLPFLIGNVRYVCEILYYSGWDWELIKTEFENLECLLLIRFLAQELIKTSLNIHEFGDQAAENQIWYFEKERYISLQTSISSSPKTFQSKIQIHSDFTLYACKKAVKDVCILTKQ